MNTLTRVVALIAVAALVAASCGSDENDEAGTAATTADVETTAAEPEATEPDDVVAGTKVTLVTHDSFALSEDVIAQFTADTGIELKIVRGDDAGTVLNQSILAAGNPLGDVIFGVDNNFMSRALDADILEPYDSPRLSAIPDEFELDPTNRLLPVDVGDVCLNYDVAWFADNGIAPPTGLADLVEPDYADLTVVQNPATSSPGLAFLMATIAEYGDGWTDYWRQLDDNGVAVSPGWSEAYYGDFTYAGGGDRPIVVSYASSPPAEVFFAEPRPATAPTAVVEASCFRQQEFIGILAGTDNRAGAEALVDFMLSVEVQNDIPWNMFVFPVADDATAPPEFVEFSLIPADPLSLPAADIEANRDTWIQEWAEIIG